MKSIDYGSGILLDIYFVNNKQKSIGDENTPSASRDAHIHRYQPIQSVRILFLL